MAQRDLHEYATLCIAKVADYSDDDAVLLAWACGETDHTLQVKPWNCLWSNLGLYFHFWPGGSDNPKPQSDVIYRYGLWGQELKEPREQKDLICRVDSELSRRITRPFYLVPRYSGPVGLCSLGIALHGLQDTYFHQNWVGKFSKHNVLPAWYNNKFTPSLPIPYGHSPKGKEPDIANATWYDPRTSQQKANWLLAIVNLGRVICALDATSVALGGNRISAIDDIAKVFLRTPDYEVRKQKLRDLAGMPSLKFSEIRRKMWKQYRVPFMVAAKAQARIVKEYLKGE